MAKKVVTMLLCLSLIFSNAVEVVAVGATDQGEGVTAETPEIQAAVESGGSLDLTRKVTFSCSGENSDCKVFITTDGSIPEPKGTSSIEGGKGITLDQYRYVRAAAYHGDEKVCENQFIYSVENNYVSPDEWLFDKNEESKIYAESGYGAGWYWNAYAEHPEIPLRTGETFYEYAAGEDGASYYLSYEDVVQLSESGNQALVFSVYHKKSVADEAGTAALFAEVEVCGDNTESVEFTRISPFIAANQPTEGWKEYYVDLSAYKGKQIRWRLGVNGSGNVIVDDIKCAEMEMAPPVVSMSQQTAYDDAKITLADEAGSQIYYKEGAMLTVDGSPDSMLGQNQTFAPTLTSSKKVLYFYGKKDGARSAMSCYELPFIITKPVTAAYTSGGTDYKYGDEVTLTTEQKLENGNPAPIYYSFKGEPIIFDDGTPSEETMLYTEPFKIEPPVTSLQAVAYVRDTLQTVSSYSIQFPKQKEVTASVPSGSSILQGTKISLSGESGAIIRYTTDGTVPTDQNGMVYTEPITIEKDTVLSVNSFKKGYMPGKTRSYSYTINTQGDVYEPNNTFDYATGLGFPFRLEGTLHTKGDQDYYSFELPSAGRLEIRLNPPVNDAGYRLTLLDENGKETAKSDAGKILSISRFVQAGKYRVLVEGEASAEKYTLNVSKQAVQGLDLSENNLLTTLAHSKSPVSWDLGIHGGGHLQMTSAYFSGWRGPVEESEDEYDGSEKILTYNPETGAVIVDENKIPYKSLSPEYHLQNALFLPELSADEGYKSLKTAIYAYGAADVYYLDSTSCWNEESTYHYLPQNAEPNDISGHIITAVGWDDTIPKEKFAVTIDGQEYMPSCDGGLIIKNSWGTEYGEAGYAYISYESASLGLNNPAIWILDELPGNYNTMYEYDKLGPVVQGVANGNVLYTKNVFTANGKELLRAVSFYTTGPEQIYDIFVKVGDEEPEHVARGSRTYAGYITQRLDKEISLPEHTKFEVIVRCESSREEKTGMFLETAIVGMSSKAAASEGQSYTSSDGVNWKDVSAENMNACIKAFTYDEGQTKMRAASMKEDTIHTAYTVEEWNAMENTVPIEFIEGAENHQTIDKRAADESQTSTGASNMKVPIESYSVEITDETLPARFDLRDIGAVTPVKDQGYIGSCWTFGAMGSAESVFMRNNNMAYTYPENIALNKTREDVTLTAEKPQIEVTASASIVPEEVGTDRVLWSYSGDLDSIDIQAASSRSGEEITLFTAKAAGTITVTAQSAVDVNRQAVMTVEITDKIVKPEPEPKPEPKPDKKPAVQPAEKKTPATPTTGDNSNVLVWVLLLAAGVGGIVWGTKKFYLK